jgi:zinc protease
LATLHNVSYATFVHPAVRTLGRLLPLVGLLGAGMGLPQLASSAAPEPVWGYLDNGMAYVLLESHAAPLIGSSVIVHAGSSREDMATSGASHFLEHLLFNGTTSRTQEQLYDEVDAIGGYNNATTRKTHVAYMMVTPAEKIRTGLEIQADMLFHSTLDPAKVEKERGIILAEMAKDQDAGSFDQERLLDLAVFGPSGPGLPTLGSVQSLQSLSRDAIEGFYRRLYTPQNMTLIVVGDFVSSEMEGEIREVFGKELPGGMPPAFAYPEPEWDPSPAVIPTSGESVVIEWTWPGPNPRDPGFLAAECIGDLLAGDDAAPLNKAVRARFADKIRSAGGRLEMIPGGSFYRYRVEADPSLSWEEAIAAIPALIEQARSMPLPADVEAWKVSAETQEYYLRERPHYYAIMVGDRVASQGIAGILGLPRRLAALSTQDLGNALADWCRGAKRTVVLLPQAGAAAAKSSDSPAAVSSPTRTTLPNGLDLLVLSSPESPVLALHLFVRGRSQAEPVGLDGSVECMQRLLSVRTASLDASAFTRRLRSVGAELKTADDPNIPYDDFYSTSGFSFVRLQTLDRYASDAFAILQDMLARPGWTDADFADTQKGMVAAAERSAAGSTATARAVVREALFPGLPRSRAVFGTPATLGAMTPGTLRELAGRYYVGRRMLLVVATSLPPDQIISIATRTVGQLPAGEAPPPSPTTPAIASRLRGDLAGSDPVPELAGLTLPDSTLLRARKIGARQAALTWVRPLGTVEVEAMPAIDVWNAALSSRIQFQLREREGLAYSIGSSVERLDNGTLLWVASAGTASASVPRVLQGFQEQLAGALTTMPDSTEVHKQGAQIYGRSLMRRATRMNRAYAAGLAVMDGRDPALIDDEIRASMEVTPEEIARRVHTLGVKGPGLLTIVY